MKLTTEEALLLTAQTRIMFCKKFSEFHEYAEVVLDRPVYIHQFADSSIWDALKSATHKDFEKRLKNMEVI
jgi:hypothetical protein